MTWLIVYTACVAAIITMNLARAWLVPLLKAHAPSGVGERVAKRNTPPEKQETEK